LWSRWEGVTYCQPASFIVPAGGDPRDKIDDTRVWQIVLPRVIPPLPMLKQFCQLGEEFRPQKKEWPYKNHRGREKKSTDEFSADIPLKIVEKKWSILLFRVVFHTRGLDYLQKWTV
jgi:hypothetical protein